MAFDGVTGTAERIDAFNDIGVDCALGQEAAVLETARLRGKYFNELMAYDLSFLLWIDNPFESRIKLLFSFLQKKYHLNLPSAQ